MQTLLLDQGTWDLCVDLNGNIAVASDPYSQAQDAASEIKTFRGECYYDVTRGLPYFTQILGKFPPLALMKSKFSQAALTVPGVRKTRCFISSVKGRTVSGQVQIENEKGVPSFAGF